MICLTRFYDQRYKRKLFQVSNENTCFFLSSDTYFVSKGIMREEFALKYFASNGSMKEWFV